MWSCECSGCDHRCVMFKARQVFRGRIRLSAPSHGGQRRPESRAFNNEGQQPMQFHCEHSTIVADSNPVVNATATKATKSHQAIQGPRKSCSTYLLALMINTIKNSLVSRIGESGLLPRLVVVLVAATETLGAKVESIAKRLVDACEVLAGHEDLGTGSVISSGNRGATLWRSNEGRRGGG